MRKRIFFAIFFTSLVFVFISVGFLLYAFTQSLEKEAFSELDNELAKIDLNDIKSHFRVTLINKNGEVVFDNTKDIFENHLQRFEVLNAIKDGYARDKRLSKSINKDSFYVAKKVIFNNDEMILRLSSDKENLNEILNNFVIFLLIFVIFVVGASFFISFMLSKSILKPLKNLDLNEPKKDYVYSELHDFIDKIRQNNIDSKRQRAEFSANVTHELKTPLTSIMLSSEMLKNDLVKSEDKAKFLDTIYLQSKALLSLIDEVIKLSFLDELDNIKMGQISLKPLIQDILKELDFKTKNISLKTELIDANYYANEQLFKTMIYNILQNAIKYNKQNGSIKIYMKESKKSLMIMIKDSGIGIDESVKDRIFERFYRADLSRNKQIEGSGLGLSIVKKIAKTHGIKIKLFSKLNEGTEFILKLKR